MTKVMEKMLTDKAARTEEVAEEIAVKEAATPFAYWGS